MAIMDSRVQFNTDGTPFDCDLENGATPVALPNSIDLGVTGRDPGQGEPVYLNIVVTETFTDGGDAATLSLAVRSDSVEDVHVTTSTGHLVTPPMLKAALVAGNTFSYVLPQGSQGNTYERYLGVIATVATAGFDAGQIEVWLGDDPVSNRKVYADATN